MSSLAGSLFLLSILSITPARALGTPGIQPQVLANTWEENNQLYSTVVLNGQELITYKATDSAKAEEKAEELAAKIGELITSGRVDPSKLTPAKEGEMAVIKMDGSTLLKFPLSESQPDQKSEGNPALSPMEQSLKVVNALRGALGATLLPQSFLKIAETTGNAIKAAVRDVGNCFSGTASWYGPKFNGRLTSDGHVFDQNGLTAAHRSLPFGTKLLVMNKKTGDSCVVQVNDRGPFVDNRVIDLSKGAAKQLNMLGNGLTEVECTIIDE